MAKRTAEDASLSAPATPQAEEAQNVQRKKRKTDSSTPKPTKTTKKTPAAPRKPRMGKDPILDAGPPQQPQPKRVSKALANKIKQIKSFRTETGSENNLLTRSNDNLNHVILGASALEGALNAMAAHWNMERTYLTALLDAEGAVINRYNRRHEYQEVITTYPMVVLDLSKTTTLDQAIHAQIEGHGIDEVNLLQVELEMYEKQRAEFVGEQLLHATEQAEAWTDDDEEQAADATLPEQVQTGGTGQIEESTEEEKRTDTPTELQALQEVDATKTHDQEIERIGVCPAPEKDM